jgi:hypothetical protein
MSLLKKIFSSLFLSINNEKDKNELIFFQIYLFYHIEKLKTVTLYY